MMKVLLATNLRLRACLAMCLNFPWFEPEVAYKTLAYKKKKVYAKCQCQNCHVYVWFANDNTISGCNGAWNSIIYLWQWNVEPFYRFGVLMSKPHPVTTLHCVWSASIRSKSYATEKFHSVSFANVNTQSYCNAMSKLIWLSALP